MSESEGAREHAVLLVEENAERAQPLRELLQDLPEVAGGEVQLVYCPPQYARVRAFQRRYVVRCLVTDNAMAGHPRLGLDLVRHLGDRTPCVVWSGSTQGLGAEAAALNRSSGRNWVFVRHAGDPEGLRRVVADILAGRHQDSPVVSEQHVRFHPGARVHELRHTIMGCFLAADIDLQQWCRDCVDGGGGKDATAWESVRAEMQTAVDRANAYLETALRESDVGELASLLGPVRDTIEQMRQGVIRPGAEADAERLLSLVRRLGTQLQSVVDAVEITGREPAGGPASDSGSEPKS